MRMTDNGPRQVLRRGYNAGSMQVSTFSRRYSSLRAGAWSGPGNTAAIHGAFQPGAASPDAGIRSVMPVSVACKLALHHTWAGAITHATAIGINMARTLHRIEESVLRREIEAAGFKLIEESFCVNLRTRATFR